MTAKNIQTQWCVTLIELLIERGWCHFFIAPGSRNTPLISAIVRHKKSVVQEGIDERSLGFFALGFAKKNRCPAIVVVTSGTAVANLMPAVVEAHLCEIPLVVISADRPFWLRDVGAAQTIDQVRIFGNYVHKCVDLPPPSRDFQSYPSFSLVLNAINDGMNNYPGPVHINLQLNEPLHNALIEDYPPKPAVLDNPPISICKEKLSEGGLIVVGEMAPDTLQPEILALAQKVQWPIYADVLSNLRLNGHPLILHHFEILLQNESFKERLNIKNILLFGQRLVSKRFWQWISALKDVQLLRLSDMARNTDQSGRFLSLPLAHLPTEFLPKKTVLEGDIFAINRAVGHLVQDYFSSRKECEAYGVLRVLDAIKEDCQLFLGTSMPIRYVDFFAKSKNEKVAIFGNRGANGIDGIISSALGVFLQDKRPGILIVGDLTFIYDTNGLMLLKTFSTPVLIVVINNQSGGIFNFLPIALEKDVLPYITTPHGVTLKHLSLAHGLNHNVLDSPDDLDEVLRMFFLKRQSMVVEVAFDGEKSAAMHIELSRKIKSLHLASDGFFRHIEHKRGVQWVKEHGKSPANIPISCMKKDQESQK